MTDVMNHKVVTVPATDDLDDDSFIAHMNLRHADSIGGLHSLWLINGSVTEAWRSFHDRLHASGSRHAHTHREP